MRPGEQAGDVGLDRGQEASGPLFLNVGCARVCACVEPEPHLRPSELRSEITQLEEERGQLHEKIAKLQR